MRPLSRSQSYLLLATALSAGLVVLHEANLLAPLTAPLIAQEEARPLTLRKGTEMVTIPVGAWVVAVDITGKEIIGRGELVGVGGGNVIIQRLNRNDAFEKPKRNIFSAQVPQYLIKIRGGSEILGDIILQDDEYIAILTVSGLQQQIPKLDIIWIREGSKDATGEFLTPVQMSQRAADMTEVVWIITSQGSVAVDISGEEVFGGEDLVDVDGATLIIQGKYRNVIPMQHIGSLYLGHAREVGRYSLKGLKYGAIAGVGGGTLLWFALFGDFYYVGGLEAYAICVGFVSYFTIPSGVALGLLAGLGRDSQAVEYLIGPGQWKIILD